MCLREFCCWSPPVEGEGLMDHRPQREYSTKFKPTESFDPPKKTLGVSDSDVKVAPTIPSRGKYSIGRLKPYTPPKETDPVVSKSIEKASAAAAPKENDGDHVHSSSQMANVNNHDKGESPPKEGVAKNSANVTNYISEQKPPSKIENEVIASTGDLCVKGETSSANLYTLEMKDEVDKQPL